MNRRGFLGRLAAVSAALPALSALEPRADSSELPTANCQLLTESREPAGPSIATSPAVETVTPAPIDRLTLLHQRGLMAPCPNNCTRTEWRAHGDRQLQCASCGWLAVRYNFELNCRCQDCQGQSFANRGIAQNGTPIERRLIVAGIPPGLYLPTDEGRPSTRYALNGYDINSDGPIHHVTEQEYARVVCAVKVANRRSEQTWSGDTRVLANGDLLLTGWGLLDCYEWQQQRGEKPAFTYAFNADGRVELVQGVVRG